ncbi:MAG: RsmE family RNA methyltransferase [Pseudomonadota bacterium]
MLNNPRFLSLEIPPIGSVLTLDEEQSSHCVRVLRLRAGENLSVIDGKGNLADGVILDANPKRTTIEIKFIRTVEQSSQLQVVFGLTKPAALELIFRKCTEVGIHSFQPLITDHSLHPGSWNEERWQKIVVEACKQSQEIWFPQICPPITLNSWLKSRDINRSLIVCDEEFRNGSKGAPVISPADILIGPEGGWSEAERDLLQKMKVSFLGLGPNRLRAETACLVALTLVKSRLGEI